MIKLKNVSKIYTTKEKEIKAVEGVSIDISTGDIYGIIGTSGAGKSTIVRCMNLLEKPTSGEVYLGNVELTSISNKELRNQRKKIGMIFQQFNLLEQRTALDNVCYPLEIIGIPKASCRERAKRLLELVGLDERMYNYPSQLSGGQKQRVAIARALATEPEVLLCDEATSALDLNTTNSILDLLKEINKQLNLTVVIITHELKVVEKICNKVAVVENGKIVEEGNTTEILNRPQSDAAKKLITFEGNAECANISFQLPANKQERLEILRYLETRGISYREGTNGN